jgi:hypothetical protein
MNQEEYVKWLENLKNPFKTVSGKENRTRYSLNSILPELDGSRLWQFYQDLRGKILSNDIIDYSTRATVRYVDMHELSKFRYYWEIYPQEMGIVVVEVEGLNLSRNSETKKLYSRGGGFLDQVNIVLAPSNDGLEQKIDELVFSYGVKIKVLQE